MIIIHRYDKVSDPSLNLRACFIFFGAFEFYLLFIPQNPSFMESAAVDIFVILIKLQKHPNIIKSAAADPISAL